MRDSDSQKIINNFINLIHSLPPMSPLRQPLIQAIGKDISPSQLQKLLKVSDRTIFRSKKIELEDSLLYTIRYKPDVKRDKRGSNLGLTLSDDTTLHHHHQQQQHHHHHQLHQHLSEVISGPTTSTTTTTSHGSHINNNNNNNNDVSVSNNPSNNNLLPSPSQHFEELASVVEQQHMENNSLLVGVNQDQHLTEHLTAAHLSESNSLPYVQHHHHHHLHHHHHSHASQPQEAAAMMEELERFQEVFGTKSSHNSTDR